MVQPLYNVMTITTDRINLNEAQTSLLEDRFILTQLQSSTLVFPASWVTEILRIDRSQILSLPFYDSLILGIVNRNGQIVPLLNTALILGLEQFSIPAQLLVVRLNEAAEGLKDVGLIIDKLIDNTTRDLLPIDLFTNHHSGEMVMVQSLLISPSLWQPKYLSIDS